MPSTVGAEDAEALRAHGLNDAAIHDAIQVISYFNYINRVAEGVGTDRSRSGRPLTHLTDTSVSGHWTSPQRPATSV